MKKSKPALYRICRWILRAALGFYFTRIEKFQGEKVPIAGPLLITSNHPNSLTDAFVIGTSVPRKVNFVATVRLFGIAPVRWLLTRCGVIPINRVADDPRAMRTVKDTFESCYRVLERGEAVAIFPEGVTRDPPQLQTVKSGPARMALEWEHRHGGKGGLKIVPVGLTFSAKDRYRSKALVNFGEPIRVGDFYMGFEQSRHERIQALTGEIEQRIKALMLHIPHLERSRVVTAVKRLYLDRLWVGNTVIHEPVPSQAGELLLTQAIAAAVDAAFEQHPGRAAEFVRKLDHYEWALRKMHLSDEVLTQFPNRQQMLQQSLAWTALAIVGAPVAAYGWVHRFIPYWVVQQAVKKFSKQPADLTHISTTTILAGMVCFPVFYLVCAIIFYWFFGFPATLWYALSLPLASLAAHYYWRGIRLFVASARATAVLLTSPGAARRLLALRSELIALIEAERSELSPAQLAGKGA